MFKVTGQIVGEGQRMVISGRPTAADYHKLFDQFGPALPFFVTPVIYKEFPFKEMGEPQINLANMKPEIGEAWVLFCCRNSSCVSDSLIRSDGFMLPFEWRKVENHSSHIPDSLKKIADKVLNFVVGVDSPEKWGLYPSDNRFGNQVDFSDPSLFGGANVGSAWGALAVGLVSARERKAPPVWPFCSLQFNEATGKPEKVEGIKQKFSVAASYTCREFVVAPEQVDEAQNALTELSSVGVAGCENIRIIPADSHSGTLVNSILHAQFDFLKPAPMLHPILFGFIGRQWLLDLLADKVAGNAITAVYSAPGGGKTALLRKFVENNEDRVLVDYTCSQRPAIDFIKAVAYRVAMLYPEEIRVGGVDKIREIAGKCESWEDLREFWLHAVVEPMRQMDSCKEEWPQKSVEVAKFIVVDALDETPDRNIVKLLSDEGLQLPECVKVVVSSRPLKDIQKILDRVDLGVIDLDAVENEAHCHEDIAHYIECRLDAVLGTEPRNERDDIAEILKKKCTSYRYAHNAFLNISNGTYSFDKLETQLPPGVEGHYLAFFDSMSKKDWESVKSVLEMLCVSPVALSVSFVNDVLERSCSEDICRLRGYVDQQDDGLLLSDRVLRDWLVDETRKSWISISERDGHLRIAEYGWMLFSDIVDEQHDVDYSADQIAVFKRKLPIELQNSLGHHVAVSGCLKSWKGRRESIRTATLILSITDDPEDKAGIASLIMVLSGKEGLKWRRVAGVVAVVGVAVSVGIFWLRFQERQRRMGVVAVELLAQVKIIDSHLMSFSRYWNKFESDRLLEIWDGRDGADNQSATRKKKIVCEECKLKYESLSSDFASNPVNHELPVSLRSAATPYPELLNILQNIYQEFYEYRNREKSALNEIMKLGECSDLESFRKKRDIVEVYAKTCSLQAEQVYLRILSLINQFGLVGRNRDGVLDSIRAFEVLRPKELIPDQIIEKRYMEIVEERKKLISIKQAELGLLRSKLANVRANVRLSHGRMSDKNVIQKNDDPNLMWGKIILLMSQGKFKDVDIQLDKYLEYTSETNPNAKAIVDSMRGYVKMAENVDINYGAIVFHVENDAKHPVLVPGDIIISLNGERVLDSDHYIEIKNKYDGKIESYKYLHLNDHGVLEERCAEGNKSDPRVALCDVVEQMK